MDKSLPRVLNGALGLSGEAGEFNDLLKKHYFQGHPLDREHLAKELGDILWYIAIAADAIGYDLETIAYMNVRKLQVRYPNGFEADRSLNRAAGDI
jgi:NTP pyrophosphatase (non-canonical NTP hydrolase)